MRRFIVVLAAAATAVTSAVVVAHTAAADEETSDSLPERAMVGYLHTSFANGSGYTRLEDVPSEWDIINLSFGETEGDGVITFDRCDAAECPERETDEEFKQAIAAQQEAGKKVVLSIGGANGTVSLTSPQQRDNFVSSVSGIIDEYGLDGVDIDFEGESLYLDPGDDDFTAPTTDVIVNLIEALETLTTDYGDDFVLTMAPETFFVQVGYEFYGGGESGGADPRTGAYLPVIHALRDDLTLLQVQQYNSGPVKGLDDQHHTMGTTDFHTAMADMVLSGFPIEGDDDRFFPPLRPEQVAVGLPATDEAGNGYTPESDVQATLDCLIAGESCQGYTPADTHPRLRGVMAWSINWDGYNDQQFSRAHREYLDRL